MLQRVCLVWWILLIPASGVAQTVAPPAPPAPSPEEPARPTGLPTRLAWTFNFDAGWGTFGFGNSLYRSPREPGITEDLSDQWFEGYIKPSLSGAYTLKSSSQIYGKVSGVGERTYGSTPPAFGIDTSSFGADDLAIGWRSGKSLTLGENAIDVTVGRAPYRLGNGFLLYDGAAEGGTRGGYWTNARRAFKFAAIGRVKPGAHTLEAFYLIRDELPENDADTRVAGVNYEYRIGADETTTVGATYMKWSADPVMKPGRDGLHVFNVRAYSAPISRIPDLSFEFEYASERNGEALASNAWTLLGAYELTTVTWSPKLSYRYAFFEGDDPATAANEAFDPLLPGFSDWGTWWQGEIAGEYFLSNSNLISHQVRAHVTPSDKIGAGLILYSFKLDQPATFGPLVRSKDAAFEADVYTDWKLNTNFTISLVGAFGDPGKAIQQLTGRTKNFVYGMAYVAYSF
jgi:hypothetical protein